jgi:hypothetical protein
LYSSIWSSPWVTVIASGFQSVNALTGPADQLLHALQWQLAGALGFPRDFDGDRAAVALALVGLVTH